jgi:hypothetical protein
MDVIWHRLELGPKGKIVPVRILQAKTCDGPRGRALGRNYVETTILNPSDIDAVMAAKAIWFRLNFSL